MPKREQEEIVNREERTEERSEKKATAKPLKRRTKKDQPEADTVKPLKRRTKRAAPESVEPEQPETRQPKIVEEQPTFPEREYSVKSPVQARDDDEKPAGPFRENRVFVLDTNVLLHDSNSLFSFQGVVVGIPFVVLEELDEFKKETGELGRNAREVIRQLDNLREQGSLNKGVRVQEGAYDFMIKVLQMPTDATGSICANTADNQIIVTIQALVKQGMEVTFITKDINARVKADALELNADDYTKGTISLETFYKGWIRVPISSGDLKLLSIEKIKNIVDVSELSPNEFVVCESQNNPHNNRVFRYLGGEQFKQVGQPETLGSFGAKNVEQLMALDLLLDDDVQIVSLLGPAGTGKTFLALLVGLYKVVKMHHYRKLLVSRPIVALGADVGYLPGELKDKLRNWMMPIYDNLEYIFSEIQGIGGRKKDEEEEFGERAKERRHRKRHPRDHEKGRVGQREHHQVEALERRGVLSMEAITYMRGRSIPNQYLFIDEVQNLTPHEVKTLVSRAGQGTKVILAGDPHQIDSPFLNFTSNGLTVTSDKFRGHPIFGTTYLEISERSELAQISADIL